MYVGRLLLALVVGLSAGLGYAAGQIETAGRLVQLETTARDLQTRLDAAEETARERTKRWLEANREAELARIKAKVAEERFDRSARLGGAICLEWLGEGVPVPEGQPILAGSKGLHTHHPDARTWVVHDGDD